VSPSETDPTVGSIGLQHVAGEDRVSLKRIGSLVSRRMDGPPAYLSDRPPALPSIRHAPVTCTESEGDAIELTPEPSVPTALLHSADSPKVASSVGNGEAAAHSLSCACTFNPAEAFVALRAPVTVARVVAHSSGGACEQAASRQSQTLWPATRPSSSQHYFDAVRTSPAIPRPLAAIGASQPRSHL
jgi:hypothetical protein